MPTPIIELAATESILGLLIDEETFRAVSQLDGTEADTIDASIVSGGTKYTARLDVKSLLSAVAAFQAATYPRISIFGQLQGTNLEKPRIVEEQQARRMQDMVKRIFDTKRGQDGWQNGWQEGRADMLIQLMQMRFGPLPEKHLQRIREADDDKLLRWMNQTLYAASPGVALR